MGFCDLQVNGYAGIDFNSDGLSGAAVEGVCTRLESQGVDSILATVITDSMEAMERRLHRVATLLREHPGLQRMIRGIHIEGPFISPESGYRGAHPADAIVPADWDTMQRLLEAGEGWVKLATLAPEHDAGLKVTRTLAERGIVVAAGHTDASLDQLRAAIDAGLTMFTHTGNGCPAVMARHDNIVQRALSLRKQLWLCFIADGAHIPFFALKNYLELAGMEKTIVVTDAMVAADLGPGRYRFGRWDLQIGNDLVARSPDGSHLVGSTVTMAKSFENLTQRLGLSAGEARRLTEVNPRRAIGETA